MDYPTPCNSARKESACSVGELGLIPGLERSLRRGHGSPLQYSYLENPQGQRSLAGYSPWGHKESGLTDQLSQHSKYNVEDDKETKLRGGK